MYFVETGLAEAFKPREQTKTPPTRQRPQPARKVPPKVPPKGPPDRFLDVYVYWDLWVPFRKDIETFRQEVAKAIGRHVAASEKTTVDKLLVGQQQKNLKGIHDTYASEEPSESKFVIVRANLRFTKNDHTGFDWLNIELPTLSLKASIK
jgi:hypothetical protein